MLLAGKIDLGLMSTPVRDRRLVSRRVFDDELVLIASTHHRFAQQTRVRLAQMRDETLFVYPPKEESGPLQNVLLPAGAAPARVEEVQLTEAITELVKAGPGRGDPGALGGAAAHRRRQPSSGARCRPAACTASGAR